MNGAPYGRQTEVLRQDIDQTRADLGETINELAARFDVPARTRAAYGRAAQRMRRSPVPWLVLAGGAAAATVVVTVLVVRGRRR